jgi:hypothetical protein
MNKLQGGAARHLSQDLSTVVEVAGRDPAGHLLDPAPVRVVGKASLLDSVLQDAFQLVFWIPLIRPRVGAFDLRREIPIWIEVTLPLVSVASTVNVFVPGEAWIVASKTLLDGSYGCSPGSRGRSVTT